MKVQTAQLLLFALGTSGSSTDFRTDLEHGVFLSISCMESSSAKSFTSTSHHFLPPSITECHFKTNNFLFLKLCPSTHNCLIYFYLKDTSVGCGEGNGTPLQYSCLENPMDGGAWWAAVHGVAKSRTRLSHFTITFHFHALEKEMATTPVFLPEESRRQRSLGGLPSMGSHRVGHDWSNLAAAAAGALVVRSGMDFSSLIHLIYTILGKSSLSLSLNLTFLIFETPINSHPQSSRGYKCCTWHADMCNVCYIGSSS